MIHEQQEEQASLYVLGTLSGVELKEFETELRGNGELRQLVGELQKVADLMALSVPQVAPAAALREKVLSRVPSPTQTQPAKAPPVPVGFQFINFDDKGWKALPVPGAFIKLLSLERERGYAVLLGKLDPGVRYPAHVNAGPEDIYILTGDLHIGERRLGVGDFHHADAGSKHEINYSVEGCTLIAVLTTDDPLVAFALA